MTLLTIFKNCNYHLYTEDVQMYRHSKVSDIVVYVGLMNEDISAVTAWSMTNDLRSNDSNYLSTTFL